MPALYTYRLFLSHAWKYDSDYARIIQFLDTAPNFSYSNYSVPKNDPVQNSNLTEALKNQIRPAQVVVILAGMYVSYSDWIHFEINFAKQLGKPILGIMPWGAERVPAAVENSANEIVGWNTSSIVSAIRRLA